MNELASVTPKALNAIKIAQLTDLHLFADEEGCLLGVRTADSFTAVMDDVENSGFDPDIYLVTGDVSQDYSAESYARYAEMTKRLKKPIFTLPGNHDDGPLMYKIFPDLGLSSARQIFCGRWQIVMLNTQVYSNPCGYLTQEQFAYLHKCLDDHKKLSTLVCLHHNTYKVGSAWLDQHCLKNGDELSALLKNHPNAKCVLCGHVHQETDMTDAHVRYLSTPSTSIQFMPKQDGFGLDHQEPGWRSLVLLGDGTIETQVHRLHNCSFSPDRASSGY